MNLTKCMMPLWLTSTYGSKKMLLPLLKQSGLLLSILIFNIAYVCEFRKHEQCYTSPPPFPRA